MPALTENNVTFKFIQSSTYFFKNDVMTISQHLLKQAYYTWDGYRNCSSTMCVKEEPAPGRWCHFSLTFFIPPPLLFLLKTCSLWNMWKLKSVQVFGKISATAFTMTTTLTNDSVVVITFTGLDNKYLKFICIDFECLSYNSGVSYKLCILNIGLMKISKLNWPQRTLCKAYGLRNSLQTYSTQYHCSLIMYSLICNITVSAFMSLLQIFTCTLLKRVLRNSYKFD